MSTSKFNWGTVILGVAARYNLALVVSCTVLRRIEQLILFLEIRVRYDEGLPFVSFDQISKRSLGVRSLMDSGSIALDNDGNPTVLASMMVSLEGLVMLLV